MIQIQMVKVRILSLATTNKNDLIFFSENGGSSDEDLPPSKRLKT